jgi:1-acyl-sn-glycerol-3-phosphate acyltransferase
MKAALLLPFSAIVVAFSTLLHVIPLLALAILKFLIPIDGMRRLIGRALTTIAEQWITVNSALIDWLAPGDWQVSGGETLRYEGWYLVTSNHQSWVDIPVLQKVFNRRIPFLKFFLKQQLIYVPLLGLAWWALDFPFMRRYSRAELERDPSKRGKDREATRRACEKFAKLPVSVMNFVEGTRLTAAKQAGQGGEFRHLLKPKAGGLAFVVDAMGHTLKSLVDVTIVYPDGSPNMIDLLSGRLRRVIVHIEERTIPAELLSGDYENDAEFRQRFQAWVNGLWQQKDELIDRLKANALR